MAFFFNVQQNHCVIIERFGKYSRTCSQGLRFRIPILEQIKRFPEWGVTAIKEGSKIELSEQHSDTPPRTAHTRDNVQVSVNATVYWKIVDPVKAVYEVDILPDAILDSALNTLRSCIGQIALDNLIGARQKLNDQISTQLSQTAAKWGVKVNRVEVQNFEVSDETQTAMLQEMEAERAKRALIATAEGEADAAVKIAEAERKARMLRADGESKAIGLIAKAEKMYLLDLKEVVGEKSASEILLAQKMLDGFVQISKGDANKVYIPNSVRGLMIDGGDI
jgi:regulator of protease activity HflC (stomatin/prohibitin superfamily)